MILTNTTRITYTELNAIFGAKTLIQPPYIDVNYDYGTYEVIHRYSSKLFSTHHVGSFIVAVWDIEMFIANVHTCKQERS